ncbi:unnamed protein product, partial [Mesorhabditis belari]|uniref:Transcription factor CBF/NF-Y/archaeal histone domain-containing protein n=1 Tax=Mesorhabditis belari TaxID=2138241 RepID=A0AAF3F5J1_9BILA
MDNHEKPIASTSCQEFWDEKKKVFKEEKGSFYTEASSKCELPMARVKKIMKIDFEMEGQMIAQDAPLFLSKAAELFIEEITLKAWANTEEQRRKTLQKNDITAACSRNDHFDFLIDIVPREEIKKTSVPNNWSSQNAAESMQATQMVAVAGGGQFGLDNVQYLIPEGNEGQQLMLRLENGQFVTATEISQPVQLGTTEDGRLVISNSLGQDENLLRVS